MNKFYLIDNDIVSISSLQSQLRASNYNVFVNHGDLGETHTFREIFRKQPSIIIMDLIFPSFDGLSLLHRLQVDRYTNNIPIVIYTSLVNEHLKNISIHKGSERFFTKESFNPERLIDRIFKIY